MNRQIALIGAPTDIGASMRGASMGPEAMRVAQLGPTLEGHGLTVLDRGNLNGPANPWLPPVNGYRHLPEVVAWNRAVHEAVYAELQGGHLPILLGGDHCLGVGSISAGDVNLFRFVETAEEAWEHLVDFYAFDAPPTVAGELDDDA